MKAQQSRLTALQAELEGVEAAKLSCEKECSSLAAHVQQLIEEKEDIAKQAEPVTWAVVEFFFYSRFSASF